MILLLIFGMIAVVIVAHFTLKHQKDKLYFKGISELKHDSYREVLIDSKLNLDSNILEKTLQECIKESNKTLLWGINKRDIESYINRLIAITPFTNRMSPNNCNMVRDILVNESVLILKSMVEINTSTEEIRVRMFKHVFSKLNIKIVN